MNTKKRTGFAMNALSFMFAGQAIAATFQRLASTSLASFSTISGSTNEAAVAFKGVGVAMDVIRFSLGQALASVLTPMVPMLMGIADWFLNLSDRTKKWVGWIMIAGIGFGKLISVGAQFVLIGASIVNMWEAMAVKEALLGRTFWARRLDSIKEMYNGIKRVTLYLAGQAVVGAKAFGTALKASLSLKMIGGWLLGIGAFVVVMQALKEKTGSWKGAWIEMGFAVLTVLALMGDAFIDFFLAPLKLAIKGWIELRKLMDKDYVAPKWLETMADPLMFTHMVANKWLDAKESIAEEENLLKIAAEEAAFAANPDDWKDNLSPAELLVYDSMGGDDFDSAETLATPQLGPTITISNTYDLNGTIGEQDIVDIIEQHKTTEQDIYDMYGNAIKVFDVGN